jgi:hypothetical protein
VCGRHDEWSQRSIADLQRTTGPFGMRSFAMDRYLLVLEYPPEFVKNFYAWACVGLLFEKYSKPRQTFISEAIRSRFLQWQATEGLYYVYHRLVVSY